MSAARDVKAVAQVIQRITSEGIQTTGMLESTVPFQVGQQQTVQLGCLLQATAVEGGVVGHQRIELVQVGTLDFLPYLLEVGSVFRVFRTDSMYLYVPVMIEIVLRLDQPGTCLRDFSVPYDADTYFTDGRPFGIGRFKIDGNKIQWFHWSVGCYLMLVVSGGWGRIKNGMIPCGSRKTGYYLARKPYRPVMFTGLQDKSVNSQSCPESDGCRQ